MAAGRPFTGGTQYGPWSKSKVQRITVHNTASERELVWRMLMAPAQIRAVGEARFGSKAAHRRYGPDFREYLRQARAYDAAAAAVGDTSRALLQYYSALQLAKAELLVAMPSSVFNVRVGHGLSFSPEAAKSVRGDSLRVQDGVFRELFRVRTGVLLPVGERLRVVELLLACPDVEWELYLAGFGRGRTATIEHFVVWDATHVWALLVVGGDVLYDSRATVRYLEQAFEAISPLQGRLPRLGRQPVRALQSRWTIPYDGTITDVELDEVCDRSFSTLRALIGVPLYGSPWVATSRLRSRFSPMPPDLARYAAIYYLSSLVRYKPSRLASDPDAAWMLEAFSEEAGPHLLRAALPGVAGTVYEFVQGDRH